MDAAQLGALEPTSHKTAFYGIVSTLANQWVRRCFHLHVIGDDHIPPQGGVIVAANHASYLDIPLLGGILKRQADYLAKRELFSWPIVGRCLRALGGIPVRRGVMDRQALRETVQRLKQGRLLVIYPEGTRSPNGRLGEAKPGLGLLVVETEAVVVPTYLHGTDHVRWGREITVVFGPPLDFRNDIASDGDRQVHPKKLYARIAASVMAQIAQLQQKVIGQAASLIPNVHEGTQGRG